MCAHTTVTINVNAHPKKQKHSRQPKEDLKQVYFCQNFNKLIAQMQDTNDLQLLKLL